MAKKAMIEREKKREKIAQRYMEKRNRLKSIINNRHESYEVRMAAQESLQKLPRNASPCRARRRCYITGRPRGVYRKFGLSRNKLREAAMCGDVPGLVKSSW